jgi:predicted nucleic acid-binding protein
LPKSVYIESSIFGYLTARPSRDVVSAARQALTLDWWESCKANFAVFVSEAVLQEISQGDPAAAQLRLQAVHGIPVVSLLNDAVKLAQELLTSSAIPKHSYIDALHIAIATLNGADFLLTWNFKHINNVETKAKIAEVIEQAGWICPVLCSPEDLLGEQS